MNDDDGADVADDGADDGVNDDGFDLYFGRLDDLNHHCRVDDWNPPAEMAVQDFAVLDDGFGDGGVCNYTKIIS